MAHPAGDGMSRRSMQGVRVCAMAALLVWAAATAKAGAGAAPRSQREGAVAQARSGDTKVALATLRALVASYADDARLLADTTIVANWAGDDAYALELYVRPQTPKATEWQGYADADFVKVGPTQQGLVTEIHVRRGDKVAKGAPLFDQDDTSDKAAVDQAARQLAQAQQRFPVHKLRPQ